MDIHKMNQFVERIYVLQRERKMVDSELTKLLEEVYDLGYDDGYETCSVNNGLETADL